MRKVAILVSPDTFHRAFARSLARIITPTLTVRLAFSIFPLSAKGDHPRSRVRDHGFDGSESRLGCSRKRRHFSHCYTLGRVTWRLCIFLGDASWDRSRETLRARYFRFASDRFAARKKKKKLGSNGPRRNFQRLLFIGNRLLVAESGDIKSSLQHSVFHACGWPPSDTIVRMNDRVNRFRPARMLLLVGENGNRIEIERTKNSALLNGRKISTSRYPSNRETRNVSLGK